MNTRILLVVAALAFGPIAIGATDNPPAKGNPQPTAPTSGATSTTGSSYLQASGFPSVHQNLPSDQLLMSEARSVRRALNENASTSHEKVAVMIEHGRIVLRGTVSSVAARRAVEKAAKDAISNRDVISQVQVQSGR